MRNHENNPPLNIEEEKSVKGIEDDPQRLLLLVDLLFMNREGEDIPS